MYGFLIALGILIALLYIEHRVKKAGLSTDILWGNSFWVIVSGLVGARIYHVIEYWEFYKNNLINTLFIWNGGMGILGGFVLGFMALFILLKKQNQSILKWLDLIALGVPLAQSIGRWGNVFNKELIPFAIYESILDVILFIFLLVISSKKTLKSGTVFFAYMAGYSIIRIVLETTRPSVWLINGWSVVQIASASILFLSVVCYSLIVRRNYDLPSK